MEFTSTVWRDIEKYFRHTYVKFDEYGDKLFYITEVSPEYVSGLDEEKTNFQLFLSDASPYTVNYILPHKAVFQYKDSVYSLQRIPARQYKRGLCEDNTQIVNVATGQKQELTFDILKAFVNKPQYSSFSAAFNTKIKTKAVALNSRMSFMRTGAILVDSTQVAKYDYTTKKISINHKIFLPEIIQHMVDYNETYEVVQ